jgi:hypothetical protein
VFSHCSVLSRYCCRVGWFFLIPFYSLSLNAQTMSVKDAGAPQAPAQQAGRVYNGEAIVVSQATIRDAAAPARPRAEPEAPAQRSAPPVPSLCDVGPAQSANALLGLLFAVALLAASYRRRRYATTCAGAAVPLSTPSSLRELRA